MKYDKKRNDFVAFVIQFDGVINKTDDDEMKHGIHLRNKHLVSVQHWVNLSFGLKLDRKRECLIRESIYRRRRIIACRQRPRAIILSTEDNCNL